MRQQESSGIAQTERIFRRLFVAQTPKDAERCVDWIYAEILDLIVRQVLTEELRRDTYTSATAVYETIDLFQDLSLLIRSKVSRRLLNIWDESRSVPTAQRMLERPIKNLAAYITVIARNACVDFLRRKYPGRHALDNALRVLFQDHPTLALWRVSIGDGEIEWRCGRKEWQIAEKSPVFVELTPSLSRGLDGLSQAQVVVHLVNHAGAPVRFTQMLNVLTEYWKVETVYQREQRESVPFRVPKPYVSGFQPEEMIHVMGALQNLWPLMTQLIPSQVAVLLLKVPPYQSGTYLDALVAYGIADWPEIATAMGIRNDILRAITPSLPLEDFEIAHLLGISTEHIPRIRQDARRRLARIQHRSET